MNRFISALALAAIAFSATGCDGFSDFVDDPLGDFELQVRVPDAELPLGDDGITVGVREGQETVAEGTVTIANDFGRIDEVESLTIRAEDMRFTPTATRTARGGSGGSGSFDLFIVIQSTTSPDIRVGIGDRVGIEDGVVTTDIEVTPEVAQEVYDILRDILGEGELSYTYTTRNVRSSDPSQPLEGTFTVLGYTGTIVATPDA